MDHCPRPQSHSNVNGPSCMGTRIVTLQLGHNNYYCVDGLRRSYIIADGMTGDNYAADGALKAAVSAILLH